MSDSFSKWLSEVISIGKDNGCKESYILCFQLDLLEHWENDLTPQEAFDIEFVGGSYEADLFLEKLLK